MDRDARRSTRIMVLLAALALALGACGGGTSDDPTAAGDTGATDEVSPSDDVAADDDMEDMDDADDMDDMDDMSEDDADGMDDMSDDAAEDGSEDVMSDDMDMDMGVEMDFGAPADPSDADRVIEVNVDNDLAFEPADHEVTAGEVITFRIANTGDVEHEFVLGDEAAQEQMAEMMQGGDDHAHSGEMSNAVTVHAGETGELTWAFTSPGTVLIGCHVPGHYEAGMVGSVVVAPAG